MADLKSLFQICESLKADFSGASLSPNAAARTAARIARIRHVGGRGGTAFPEGQSCSPIPANRTQARIGRFRLVGRLKDKSITEQTRLDMESP